ncbi:MAG: hypothetical protein JRE92_01700 [Deltaproteobacteria bacterium]|nr:hypothetical protein [Deltaproteobacteria bacterium]
MSENDGVRCQGKEMADPETRHLKPIQIISMLAAPQGSLFPSEVSEKA